MDVRHIAVTLVAAATSAVVTLVVAGTDLLYAWWVLAPGAALLAVLMGLRRYRPAVLHPWLVLAGSLALLWAGWTISAAVGSGLADGAAAASLAIVRDACYLIAYPTLGIAGLLMVRCRTGGRDRDNVVDASIVMAALAIVLGAWLFGGGEVPERVGALDRAWVSLSPLVLAAVVSASVRVLFADAHRLAAAWLLLASSTLTLLGNLWTSQLLRDGSPIQVPGIDVLWVLGFVAVASAALHPSMRVLTDRMPDARIGRGMPVDRLALLGGALLASPFAQLRLGGGSLEERSVALGGVLVAALVLWRVVRLLRERDHARQALAEAAARDAMVARVGRWAVSERSTDELLRETETMLVRGLPELRCRIEDADDPTVELDADGPVSCYDIDDGTATVAHLLVVAPAQRPSVAGQPEFLEAVAALLSSALRRRAAEARLRHDFLHDALTGLANRSLALDRLTRLLRRRAAGPVAAVFLDLDGFKAVNDTFGHAAGDEVLRTVASRLSAAVRDGDTVARLAGDEFLVLIADVDDDLAGLVARLQEAATQVITGQGTSVSVSASIGVAISVGEHDAEALLERADAAMYRTKHGATTEPSWCRDPAELVAGRSSA